MARDIIIGTPWYMHAAMIPDGISSQTGASQMKSSLPSSVTA